MHGDYHAANVMFSRSGPEVVAIVAVVLSGCQALGLLQLQLAYLPVVIPIVFVSACAFAALGLCFTALVPTIDHMNLPIFLVVLPLGFVSATYFPLGHPVLAAISLANPLYHLAEGMRGLLLGDNAAYHLGGLAGLVVLMLGLTIGIVIGWLFSRQKNLRLQTELEKDRAVHAERLKTYHEAESTLREAFHALSADALSA